MKRYSFLFFVLCIFLFSCKNSLEDNCFTTKERHYDYKEEVPFTVEEILKNKPKNLSVSQLKDFRSFKTDSTEANYYDFKNEKEELKKYEAHKKLYAKFDSAFNEQFAYFAKQSVGKAEYAFAQNNLGFWLTKIDGTTAKAYFLGLSFSHYYFNKIQTQPIIKDGELQLQGSFVKIVKVAGLPGYDDYSAIEDGKLFRIKLSDLEKDSDHDGYNDIFEESFGLNPENGDTDSDGINDFNDFNPLHKSGKNKFTMLFEELVPKYAAVEGQDFKKMNYFFDVYGNDCEYFQMINPELRTFIVAENKNKLPYYLRVTDVIHGGLSKLRKDPKNPEKFYIMKWGSSSTYDMAVEFKNGKWQIEIISSTVV